MKKVWCIFIILFISVQLNAESLNLDKYKGKVVYLDFWASWCGPCKDSFPWLNKLVKDHSDIVVIGINLDKSKSDADDFLKKYPANFKIIYNSAGDLAQKYKVKGMPYSIMIDKSGKKRYSHIGFSDEKSKEYSTQIKELLGEK